MFPNFICLMTVSIKHLTFPFPARTWCTCRISPTTPWSRRCWTPCRWSCGCSWILQMALKSTRPPPAWSCGSATQSSPVVSCTKEHEHHEQEHFFSIRIDCVHDNKHLFVSTSGSVSASPVLVATLNVPAALTNPAHLSVPGMYYIDPNQGSPADALLAYCSFSSTLIQTCIHPENSQVEEASALNDLLLWTFISEVPHCHAGLFPCF